MTEKIDNLYLSKIEAWNKNHITEAILDNNAILIDNLKRLSLPDEPENMLYGTYIAILTLWSSAKIQGTYEGFDEFLKMQTYDSKNSSKARYILTFNVSDNIYPRLLADEELKHIDLADMYLWPLWPLCVDEDSVDEDSEDGSFGFSDFWISHVDWSPFTEEEFEKVIELVENDLYYDYSHEEMTIAPYTEDERFLHVRIYEHENESLFIEED